MMDSRNLNRSRFSFCEPPSEKFGSHSDLAHDETRFYCLDRYAADFIHGYLGAPEPLEKTLDEFEEILNSGKEKTDPSRLRIVLLDSVRGAEFFLVGKDTEENRLRYGKSKENILAYHVQHILNVQKFCREWRNMVPSEMLLRLAEAGLKGDMQDLIQALEKLRPVYNSTGSWLGLESVIRRAQKQKETYEKWSSIVPAEAVRNLVVFSLSRNMRELKKLLNNLANAYPKLQKVNFQDILCQVQLQKERNEAAGFSSPPWSSDLSEGMRPFDALVYQPEKTQALSELCLHDDVLTSVRLFMDCYDHREELERENLPCGSRILLAGPPGNGKTALAGAIAKEMGLPIYFFNMANVRDGHIGAMSRNVDTVFRGISEKGAAILFLDECDSMAGKRLYEHGADREDSAGLNSILTNLDRLGHDTVVIAATNHPDELDDAFKRRFNETIWLAPPSVDDALRFVNRYQDEHHVSFFYSPEEVKQILDGKPWSKVVEFCQTLHRNRIIGRSERFPAGWTGKTEVKKSQIGFRHSEAR